MTVEHERQCERTIASVVHEIDDLKHRLADALAVIAQVEALAYAPELGADYADSAVVVDATLLQQTLKKPKGSPA